MKTSEWMRYALAVSLTLFGLMATVTNACAGPTNTIPQVTKIRQILNAHPQTKLQDHPVWLRKTVIQQVLNDQFFLIGPTKRREVVVRSKEKHRALKPGQEVEVKGIIMQVPQQLTSWYLTPEHQKIVVKHPVYIDAFNVTLHTNAPFGGKAAATNSTNGARQRNQR